MVMDSGPFPMGRMRVFAWDSPVGKVSCGYYDSGRSRDAKEVPKGFSGVESIQMRDEGMVRFRRWKDSEAMETLVDVRRLPYTDVGVLEAWKPAAGEAWRSLLRFDETGDVSWVDWDAALADPAKADGLKDILRGGLAVPVEDLPEFYKKHRYGFYVNFSDRAISLAWSHNDRARALWNSIQGFLDDTDDEL